MRIDWNEWIENELENMTVAIKKAEITAEENTHFDTHRFRIKPSTKKKCFMKH